MRENESQKIVSAKLIFICLKDNIDKPVDILSIGAHNYHENLVE